MDKCHLPPQLPVAELGGDRRVLIEHHRSIIRYSREEIAVAMDYGALCIRGSGLEIAQISRVQIVVTGQIASLTVERGGA